MAFEKIAEQKIREAVARGEFDNLPGAGQPIDLEEYFRTPEPLRMAYSILKSAQCLPEELELMREIASIDRAVSETSDAETRARLESLLRDRRLQLAIRLERMRAQRR